MADLNFYPETQVTKNKIFTVAAHLFALKGYNGVSMREISEQSGFTKPTIYYYFPNKESIYKELLIIGMKHTEKAFEKIIAKDTSVKSKLIDIVNLRFETTIKFPEFTTFFIRIYLSMEHLPFMDEYKAEFAKKRSALVNLIQEGIDTGEFGASANAEIASEIFSGVLLYYANNQLLNKKQILSNQLAENIVEILFKGLNE